MNAKRVLYTKFQSSLPNIYFRLSGFQSLLLLIYFRDWWNSCSHCTKVATSDKNTIFNISNNMLCKVGISNSLCNRTIQRLNDCGDFCDGKKLRRADLQSGASLIR